ncbi:DUF6265 family protein [Flavobacterium sp.]|uniref:DUF6265 family protein n=1 Tax=Flavobacterium sp. TaxID=239 RepID=UPI002618F0C2|nr:DUF6265 family protein [Flavobacterium sp.]
MRKTLLTTLIVAIAFTSFKKNSQEEVFGNQTKKEFTQLNKVNWFLGNWENSTKEATFKEIWNKNNDSSYIGESFVIVEKDTVFYEKIDLFQSKDSLFYKVSVKDQNKEKPVSFYMTKSNDKEVTFENPKHDFPTKIVYTKITNDSLVATIYGKKDGKEMSETFPMKKTK